MEITESVFVGDTSSTNLKLQRIKELGVRLSLDDFGTGYSSLSHLLRFPIDTLKIDKSFVDDVATNPDAHAVAAAIVQLGKTLNLEVVAEGIEDVEQLEALNALSCGLGQGYHFARPLPSAGVAELLIADNLVRNSSSE